MHSRLQGPPCARATCYGVEPQRAARDPTQLFRAILRRFFSRTPRSPPASFRYEDFIVDPEGEMRGLLAALRLSFEPTMLRFGEFTHADDRMKLWGTAANESPAESFLQHDLGDSIRRAESPKASESTTGWPILSGHRRSHPEGRNSSRR